jgi:polar amino acid transport system substrate-binding protein
MKKGLVCRMVLGILVAALALSGNVFGGEMQQKLTEESTVEQLLKRGTLRVGMSTFVPWAMQDKTGKLIGFEIDVATRLAQDMGVKVEFVPTKWAGIIPALLTGKFDVIIGGMGILPQRNLKVNFTIPYDVTGMSIVANKDLAGSFKSLDDFNRPDVMIAVRLGGTPVAAAEKFQALKYPDKLFLPVQGTFTKEPIGFALKKGDVDTLNFFNNWITVVQAEGWLAERKHYWFETRDWEDLIK